jgi:hypothetical protein
MLYLLIVVIVIVLPFGYWYGELIFSRFYGYEVINL